MLGLEAIPSVSAAQAKCIDDLAEECRDPMLQADGDRARRQAPGHPGLAAIGQHRAIRVEKLMQHLAPWSPSRNAGAGS